MQTQSHLQRHLAAIIDAAATRLNGRAASAFHRIGEQSCRNHVSATVQALAEDLAAGKREAVRSAMQSLVADLAIASMTFADLRFFALTLRDAVRNTLEPDDFDLRLRVEDWFFELVLVCSMHFAIQREAQLQERSVKLELRQLESQLGELKAALADKERLLEVIRQASTPIAPVVEGILVVPLVGVFDGFRAEVLTEKLLHEVTHVHARAVILDISGVPLFDNDAAQLIVRVARAVRLLGAHAILVGMSPMNARTIVDLGIDMSGLRTYGTLQDGLAHALVLQRLRLAPV